jgi:hypothetical protein
MYWEDQTFDEYITACHEHLSPEFQTEDDESIGTPPPSTQPKDKWCPARLKPWSDFLRQQSITFGELYATCSPDRRVFESKSSVACLRERSALHPIRDERTLECFLEKGVEDPLRRIIDKFWELDEFRGTFDVGNGIHFDNLLNALSDRGGKVAAENIRNYTSDQTRVYRSTDKSRKSQPWRCKTQKREMIYICEYKTPHKLTAPHLRKGLCSIDIYEEVVNRKIIPTDTEARFQYYAERLTAAALTQIYHYMILGGLEYSLLTTSEAIVFLKVDWQEPDTLYYHLAEPKSEVTAHPDNVPSCAAIGQFLAFTLLACGSPSQKQRHGQDEIARVTKTLKTWSEDFGTILNSIPTGERKAPEGSSSYTPTTYSTFDRSPAILPKPQPQPTIHDPVEDALLRHWLSSSDDFADILLRLRGTHQQAHDYCTQKCLLGLVDGNLLDPECPNVAFHCSNTSTAYADLHHPVKYDEWLRLLKQQLGSSLDQGVIKLGIQGTRGVLFKITMLKYGYKFVCKGTVQAFISDLENEVDVYARLKPAQGTSVPVFLGTLNLRSVNRTYYYDVCVNIVHMTFLSVSNSRSHSLLISPTLKAEALLFGPI